jgi:hypothetical protein
MMRGRPRPAEGKEDAEHKEEKGTVPKTSPLAGGGEAIRVPSSGAKGNLHDYRLASPQRKKLGQTESDFG